MLIRLDPEEDPSYTRIKERVSKIEITSGVATVAECATGRELQSTRIQHRPMELRMQLEELRMLALSMAIILQAVRRKHTVVNCKKNNFF
jgi:hypothetical protein